jgi:outer membrane protein OmpA-like peptidoglycan-associated protein
MTAQRTLDRKTKLAIGAVIAILLLIILMTMRSLVASMTPVALVAQSDSGDNQLIVIGGQAQYFDPSTVAGKVANWINTGKTKTEAFTIGEQNFEPGSDQITPAGQVRLNRLVGFLKSDPGVTAELFVTTYEGANAQDREQLAKQRALRVRTAAIGQGIDPSRIAATIQKPISSGGASKQPPPMMVLVLSK